MKLGDLVRVSNPNLMDAQTKRYPHLSEIGVVVGLEGSHPVVHFPSMKLRMALGFLEVISESG